MKTIGPPANATSRSGISEHQPAAGSAALAEHEWQRAIVRAADELGLTRVGFAPARPFHEAGQRLADYVRESRHASMAYLARFETRSEPRALLAEVKTVIAVALSYAGGNQLVPLRRGRSSELPASVASYALGRDYHHVLKLKLLKLGDACADIMGRRVLARSCVDTAPLLEREAARRAGVGFIAKSSMNIIPGVGSYFVLGELLIDVDLPATTLAAEGCGRCRACLDACPTSAFVDAYMLDARRCIAYLTIEHRGVIPQELRAAIGSHVFGCDICQDVCPYNASNGQRTASPELAPREEVLFLDLLELLNLTAAGYRRLVRGSSLRRATRRMLQRNAAIALGNSNSPAAVPALTDALANNPSDLVRGHVAWALGRLVKHAESSSLHALETARRQDPTDWVREEARLAIAVWRRFRP